jgi:hypothetical protein
MGSTRRAFLTFFASGAALTGAGLIAEVQVSAQHPNPLQQQTTVPPSDRSLLPRPAGPPTDAQLRQNERDIRKDVDQLFSLAQELKTLSSKSDAAQELSVALVQKTEEIEKLAKKIRDLARD